MASETLRKTVFHPRHAAAGARFVPFGGWDMPVQFTGIQQEHQAVRGDVGLFDVSHMGEVEVLGDDAVAAFNRLITNDLEAIPDGQALYTAMCTPAGGIVDDLIVYRLSRQRVFVCVNASNRAKDFAWIVEHLTGATAHDRSDDYAQLALQGRNAQALLDPLCAADLAALGRFRCAETTIASHPCLVSRTGYTGEDGFEIYMPVEHGLPIYDALLAARPDLPLIGLGARDTLRLEMKMALYGNDIDETTTPLEAGLSWVVKFGKADFIGKDALAAQKAAGIPRRLVAFKLDGRAPARHGYPVLDEAGAAVGHVTSGTRSPSLGVNIGLAYVPDGQHKIGAPIRVGVRDRVETGVIVKPPLRPAR
ncbi:MAG: glycine cleavage system aminomethyltransferase GcvT [Myxococcales bacterium]|nr:glycine cleavage system aminomethyltransferase GcvT [Myxococcales bacterium]